jgi:hypothetical protein
MTRRRCCQVKEFIFVEDEEFAAAFQGGPESPPSSLPGGELPAPQLSHSLSSQRLAFAADAASLRTWPEALRTLVAMCAQGRGYTASNTQLWSNWRGESPDRRPWVVVGSSLDARAPLHSRSHPTHCEPSSLELYGIL